MSQKQLRTVKSEEEKRTFDWRDLRVLKCVQTFFPRIIREFDDGVEERAMVYLRCTL